MVLSSQVSWLFFKARAAAAVPSDNTGSDSGHPDRRPGNASQEFTRNQIFKMIKRQREVFSWEFILLGAGQDAISTGKQMAIPIANAVAFNEAPGGTARAFAAVSEVAAAYRAGEADYARHLTKAAKEKKA
jgi:hypothetical protein